MRKKKLIISLSVILAIIIALTVILCVLFVPRKKKLSSLILTEGIVKIECLDRRYYEPESEFITYELDESKWEEFIRKTQNTKYQKEEYAIKTQGQYEFIIYYESGIETHFDQYRCYNMENNETVKITNFKSSVVEDKYFELFIS